MFYYESEEDDPIKTKEQEGKEKVGLPEGYVYVPRNILVRAWSWMLYAGFWAFGHWYEKRYWKLKIHGREKLKAAKGTGYMIYANHTNPFHDVFGPGVVVRSRRIFTVISPVNLKLPGIGWTLPYIGGLPLGGTPEEKAAFNAAVDERLAEKRVVVIYPEAHVWPYYTGIRKFPAGSRSFKYAARNGVPVYAMTTTFHKRRGTRKGSRKGKHYEVEWEVKRGRELPRMEVYIDGPFYADPKRSLEENCDYLADQVYEAMVEAAKHNTYEYFEYKKRDGAGKAGASGKAEAKKVNLDESTKTKKGGK